MSFRQHVIIGVVLISFLSCITKSTNVIDKSPVKYLEIPTNSIDHTLLSYDNTVSLWKLDNKPYSGYIVEYYPDSILKQKTGIIDGRKEHRSTFWHPNGKVKQIAFYHLGKLNGSKKVWSSDSTHILLSSLNYVEGKAHGEQLKWYSSGELYKKLNLNMGKEEGIQQAYRKNGDLYANYEAKEGRIFGLKKAALCFGLDDEIIQYEK